MAVLAELRAAVAAGDWDGAMRLAMSLGPVAAPGNAIDEYLRELEAILAMARERRREMRTALARVQAANGFARQSFGASPGF